jgi:hypothetical protein
LGTTVSRLHGPTHGRGSCSVCADLWKRWHANSLEVVTQSIAAARDAAPASDEPGALKTLLAGAAEAADKLAALEPSPDQKEQDSASITDVAARLFFARERAREGNETAIAQSIDEVLVVFRSRNQ